MISSISPQKSKMNNQITHLTYGLKTNHSLINPHRRLGYFLNSFLIYHFLTYIDIFQCFVIIFALLYETQCSTSINLGKFKVWTTLGLRCMKHVLVLIQGMDTKDTLGCPI